MASWRSVRSWFRPNKDALALLGAAALPEPVEGIIATTIARTKLWRDEREQIARELIAHAQDAIEAGRSPEQIVETFGDPRRVARLLRRSMKRKRPFVWQAYRFSARAVRFVLLVLLVSYGWLAVRFYLAEPKIRVNYAAQLEARNEGYRDDQKSWPILVECGLQWSQINYTLSNEQADRVMGLEPEQQITGMSIFPEVDPSHPDYSSIAQAVRDFSPNLAQLRDAAARPIVGVPVGYETTKIEWSGRSWTNGIVPAKPGAYEHRSLVEVLLPNLGYTRGLSQVLIFDARLALAEEDTGRAIEDYIAVLGLARQVRQEPFMISKLVGIAIHQLCMNEIQRVLGEHPDTFTRDDLTRLAHTHAQFADHHGLGLDTERYVFSDIIQRIYSDNGHGNGHLTAKGLQQLRSMYSPPEDLGVSAVIKESESLQAMTMPLSLIASNDRATELAFHRAAMDQFQLAIDQGPEWLPLVIKTMDEIDTEDSRSEENPMRYSLISIMMPALGQAVVRDYLHEQKKGAFSLMLAIESYRIETAELPESLAVLAPRYLPAVPEDLMDPGQPIKYLRSDDAYILYSVGSDGDDDNGAAPTPSNERYRIPESQFELRFTQGYDPITGEAMFEAYGKPVLAEPQGPDGDWILIDTRPQPETDPGPADDD